LGIPAELNASSGGTERHSGMIPNNHRIVATLAISIVRKVFASSRESIVSGAKRRWAPARVNAELAMDRVAGAHHLRCGRIDDARTEARVHYF